MKSRAEQGRRMVTTKKRRGKRSAPTLPAGQSGAMDWKYVEADALNPSILACLRRRDAGYPAPPAQSRTCGFPASGSSVVLAFARAMKIMQTPRGVRRPSR